MASVLRTIKFDHSVFQQELAEFENLLASKSDLSESADILPFFKSREHLSACVGALYLNIPVATEICYEFDMQGAFRADMLLGSKKDKKFCIVEFESGEQGVIFKKRPAKYPEWSTAFEHGFSQLVDWFFSLADQRRSDDFTATFGNGYIAFVGLLVMGRTSGLDELKQKRLAWRSDRVTIDTHRITCVTFDQLYLELKAKYDFSAAVAEAQGRKTDTSLPSLE